jgi:hypothetical protein
MSTKTPSGAIAGRGESSKGSARPKSRTLDVWRDAVSQASLVDDHARAGLAATVIEGSRRAQSVTLWGSAEGEAAQSRSATGVTALFIGLAGARRDADRVRGRTRWSAGAPRSTVVTQGARPATDTEVRRPLHGVGADPLPAAEGPIDPTDFVTAEEPLDGDARFVGGAGARHAPVRWGRLSGYAVALSAGHQSTALLFGATAVDEELTGCLGRPPRPHGAAPGEAERTEQRWTQGSGHRHDAILC